MRGGHIAHGTVAGGLLGLLALASVSVGCSPDVFVLERTDAGSTSLQLPESTGAQTGAGSSSGSSSGVVRDTDEPPPGCDPDAGCPTRIDLLFVIDNSGTMGEEQLILARNFPALLDELQTLTDTAGVPVSPDVHIMVTTTDMGNPQCDNEFKPPGYEEQRGAPVATPCTERIERFTARGNTPEVLESACLEVCDPDSPAAPQGHFIAFDAQGDNVQGGSPTDALGCIGPQGIDGCGFESPLEAMQQALNPCACWNDPARCGEAAVAECEAGEVEYEGSFLRDDAILAIVMITDEADCSVRDFSIMDGETFGAEHPVSGERGPTSAVCWNAGVVCTELDPETGTYSGCSSANWGANGASGVSDDDAVLHPVSRYESLLDALRADGREVMMLGVLGVPEVTAHAPMPPHQPVAGGVAELAYRDWRDPAFPEGDILPEDWAQGVDAATQQYEFGVGPGCTVATPEHVGQAVPPVRIRRVCEGLNHPDDPRTAFDESQTRCCIESVCGEDFTPALRCLTGLIRTAIVPAG